MIKKLLFATLLIATAINAESETPKKDKYEEWCDNLRLNKDQLKKIYKILKGKLENKPNKFDGKDSLIEIALEQMFSLGSLDYLYNVADNHEILKNDDKLKKQADIFVNATLTKCKLCIEKKLAAMKEKK